MSSPNRALVKKISRAPTTHLSCEFLRTCALFPMSFIVIQFKNCFATMSICSQDYYHWHNIITFFVYMIDIFVCLLNKIPSNNCKWCKTCITDTECFGNLIFCSIHNFPHILQIFYIWHVNYWQYKKCFNWFC